MKTRTKAGWYPAADAPGMERRWDGKAWTDDVRPAPPQPQRTSGVSVVAVALGILIAAGVIWLVYYVAHANDGLDCSLDNLDRSQQGQPTVVCPE